MMQRILATIGLAPDPEPERVHDYRPKLGPLTEPKPNPRLLTGRGLPEHSLMTTVQLPEGAVVERRGVFARAACNHRFKTSYARIDHSAGPGSFADNFEGTACCECGMVIFEFQTL
jgi:hypothetical protein